ncbi:hypothetical protein [Clostridium sp. CCUG 7971]|uniref:hypothetical protein n=1 Tax=Clostridium sp. CCUG 7971 TaxID=2811414 RepID=UPI001ABA0956|nr:hypothetical protein [Clostridium sp. CCUG 7971]MBO3443399.1 hypothetical protein [Clostridium sp. CCUG 7971]
MKLKENFVKKDTNVKHWDWGQYDRELKYDYEKEHHSKVKTYNLSKEEMEKYLKKFK